ncbi:ferric reductase-like transmembrane domain-containing protein [Anthocerotibacter panamensis]|uniref:ferric reductase-like transmembrane domain-containing protein n=1 Tax=Anthocerotibacter panamensis TaxID=2857077 RepID=UPI001C4028BD|nr:ferric reductase-like transmembrane domain-containing protein [Anthocerotibacter panamensis]
MQRTVWSGQVKWFWPLFSILLAALWVGLIVADGFTREDHLLGQHLHEAQGQLALLGLLLLLISRPLAPWVPQLLQERRWLGLLTFGFALTHGVGAYNHSLGGRWDGLLFLDPWLQATVVLGGVSLVLLVPLALTSFDYAVRALGRLWNKLHRLILPAAILAVVHTLGSGIDYFNTPQTEPTRILASVGLLLGVGLVVWFRPNKNTL